MSLKTIQNLAHQIQLHKKKICLWQNSYELKGLPPFYCSVDLRDSGHKIVPVDSNLFPAGFNNICSEDLKAALPLFQREVKRVGTHHALEIKKVVIVPESHTQNSYYIQNLVHLIDLAEDSGYEVRLGWLDSSLEAFDQIDLHSHSGKVLTAHKIRVKEGRLQAGNFDPDLILLNNDFSGGYPVIFDQVKQPVVPSHFLGWHTRKKNQHFDFYNRLAREFAEIIEIDPWTIQIESEEVSPVQFNSGVGIEAVAEATDRILEKIQKSYTQRSISRTPFVFIKNNAGTYGMGIMVVRSGEEVIKMNRRVKNKMSVGKNKSAIESVLIQEGIPTASFVDGLATEPVVYLMGYELMGAFLRTNTEKGDEENLNSQGMIFKKMCMSELAQFGQEDHPEKARELVYGAIARISVLATGLEMAHHAK